MKTQSKVILIVLVIILILVLLSIIIVFVFKPDFLFNKKTKVENKVYQEFLIRVKDKYSSQQIDSNVLIYTQNKNNILLYNLSSKNGTYENINLSVNDNIIKTQLVCKNESVLFGKKEICKNVLLNPILNYSSYLFIIDEPGYYRYSGIVNFSYSTNKIQEFVLIPAADIKILSPNMLNSGDYNNLYLINIFVSSYQGDLINGIICLKYNVGVVTAYLQDSKYLMLMKIQSPNEMNKCYQITQNYTINQNFDFKVYYKSTELMDNDYLEVCVFDKEYSFIQNKDVYEEYGRDLGVQNKCLRLTKNGNSNM